jgi:hypothetical protein
MAACDDGRSAHEHGFSRAIRGSPLTDFSPKLSRHLQPPSGRNSAYGVPCYRAGLTASSCSFTSTVSMGRHKGVRVAGLDFAIVSGHEGVTYGPIQLGGYAGRRSPGQPSQPIAFQSAACRRRDPPIT